MGLCRGGQSYFGVGLEQELIEICCYGVRSSYDLVGRRALRPRI